MCVFAAREPEVALSRSRTVICGCWLATIARGCRGPRHPAPQDIGGPTLGCVSTQPRHPNAQPISGPEEALGKDVSTSPGTAGTTSPPPEDVGLASFGPSLQPPAESYSVSFSPRSQPHEASRSFRGGSDTGTSVLTCAQTTRGRRLALPQCQLEARAQESPVEAGRGGTGAGLPRPGPDPCAGPGEAPLHLTSSSSSPPEVGWGGAGGAARPWLSTRDPTRAYLGKVGRGRCLLPAAFFDVEAKSLLICLLVSTTVTPSLSGGEVGEG